MKKYRFSVCIFPLIALVLEMLPYGAVLRFANPEAEAIRRTFSYFDPTPFGYANFAPFLTALCSVGAITLCIIACIRHKRNLYKVTVVLCAITLVLSLCPLMIGVKFFSVIGALISVSWALATCICFGYYKKLKK
ncbi:MAG: hypothetical protein IJZ93_06670 [Clostridia bacterium]|nr:hypothetical protein [Clostridia bacterium]